MRNKTLRKSFPVVILVLLISIILLNRDINFECKKNFIETTFSMKDSFVKRKLVEFIRANSKGFFLRPLLSLFYEINSERQKKIQFEANDLLLIHHHKPVPIDVEKIIELTQDKDITVRKSAIMYLGLIETINSSQILLDTASSEQDSEIRKFAIISMGSQGARLSRKAQSYLADRAVNSKHAFIRREAISALQSTGNREHIDTIKRALNDKNRQNVIYAIYVLGKLGDIDCIKYIKPFLYDNDKEIRDKAKNVIDKQLSWHWKEPFYWRF